MIQVCCFHDEYCGILCNGCRFVFMATVMDSRNFPCSTVQYSTVLYLPPRYATCRYLIDEPVCNPTQVACYVANCTRLTGWIAPSPPTCRADVVIAGATSCGADVAASWAAPLRRPGPPPFSSRHVLRRAHRCAKVAVNQPVPPQTSRLVKPKCQGLRASLVQAVGPPVPSRSLATRAIEL